MQHKISDLIQAHHENAPAIGALNRPWMSYGDLRELSEKIRTNLRQLGIGTTDRVAIVLANGPEMAAAFVTIAQCATTAPLNPGYREDEFKFYLKDLQAKALVVDAAYNGPALAAAASLKLRVLRLKSGPSLPAGMFELIGDGSPVEDSQTQNDSVALILHTSGTTSRPKIVPLLQSNIAASAMNIQKSLALAPEDRCLNVMPLFHIHGLIAAVSASLAAGASVWCSPGFDALKFFAWMNDARPTWYTAVPTMHQAILSRAKRNADVINNVPLRFLRSSSASLPPQVFSALNETFKAPVIEGYGMTEASHQMTSNPLPPQAQKPGYVGVEAGPKVRIADAIENILIDGLGEVVISGPNVTPGYESNPKANESSFFDAEGSRWFRTGDQGIFDGENYLRITGRLKEIINRGGEKISPLEVDETLMDHPAIEQCVAFALPHDKLGEEVAVAIVLRDGEQASEADIRAFANARMAAFKVPRKILILKDIPKGSTGKMQRIGMAEKLGLV